MVREYHFGGKLVDRGQKIAELILGPKQFKGWPCFIHSGFVSLMRPSFVTKLSFLEGNALRMYLKTAEKLKSITKPNSLHASLPNLSDAKHLEKSSHRICVSTSGGWNKCYVLSLLKPSFLFIS